jgi:hypothetical protein
VEAVSTILTANRNEAGGVDIHHHDCDVVHTQTPPLAPPVGLLRQLIGEDTRVPGEGREGRGEGKGGKRHIKRMIETFNWQ